jgi:hypothetical protein
VTFRVSQHGALGSKRITENQRGFCRERNQQEAPSPIAIRRWVRQWREEGSVTCKSHLVGSLQFAHLTKLPECWRPSAAVRGDLHVRSQVATLDRDEWMNFCPRIFHQTVVPCAFNKMVLRPARLRLASLRFAVCFRSGWYYYNSYHCVTVAYSIQYSNMLYRSVG